MPNNREWALFIWFGIAILWVLSRKDIRASLGQVLRQVGSPKLAIPLGGMLGYIALEVWLGERLALWRPDLTTDTLLWVAVSAFALFLNLNDASKKPRFFRHRLLATLGISESLQFLTNLFVLPLVAEVFILPILVFLAMMAVVAERDDQFRVVKKLANGLLALSGIALLSYALGQLFAHWGQIDWYSVLRQFALPIWLTAGLLPFVYVLSLYGNYEQAFMRIDLFSGDRKSRWRAKMALVTKLHVRSRDSHAFGGPWFARIVAAPNFAAARQVVADFKQSRLDAERAKVEERERLRRYAGSDETDEEGRRLDRREFKETTSALRWLATCQMGWYRNEDRGDKRYRADLLTVLGDDFTRHGLPADSGITMAVAKNGQAWYAWRRTVTGWCFAIGAAGPPPEQWEYDGPEPPKGFPGKDRRWGERAFSDYANPNW